MHFDIFRPIFAVMRGNTLFQLVVIMIVMDVLFGSLRAAKDRAFNSSVGIDGGIRKVGMLLSLVCLVFVDILCPVNLIGFIPEVLREYIHLKDITVMEFFALLYIVYEVLSVLKNMTLSGLPVRRVWVTVKAFLKKNTGEFIEIEEKE
jgi:protein utxA